MIMTSNTYRVCLGFVTQRVIRSAAYYGVLYMKLVDGEVVDVEEEEIDDVLQHIGRYL